MGRLSIRSRPLDVHKKLQIVKSVKEFEDDEVTISSTRHSQILRLTAEDETEVHQASIKKLAGEIPTHNLLLLTHMRGTTLKLFRNLYHIYVEEELGQIWESLLNMIWTMKMRIGWFETILFKLEVLDHKAERAGIITLVSPIPVLLQLDSAAEALLSLNIRYIACLQLLEGKTSSSCA